jgi:hypothetical protein
VNFDPFSFQRRRDAQLLPWIARHADQISGNLGTTPQQVLASYESIRAQLVALVKAGTSSVRGDDMDGNVASAIYGNVRFIRATLDILVHDEYVKAPSASGEVEAVHVERAWARLAPALQQYDTLAATKTRYGVTDSTDAFGRTGKVVTRYSILGAARDAAARAGSDAVVNLGSVGTTVRCNDTVWETNPRFYTKEADKMTKKYPFFGYLNGVPMCAFWQYEPQDRKLDLPGVPRMLMIQGELDPATAYEGALRTHQDTAHATRFVAIDDEGQHGQYIGSASACAEAIGDRFVFTGELPGTNQVCGTSPLPEDGAVYPVYGPVDGNAVKLPKKVGHGTNPALRSVLDQIAENSLG